MNEIFLKSEQGHEPVIIEAIFNAAVERVFKAWTDPDELVKWFGSNPNSLKSAEIDLRVGGRYRFNFPPSGSSKTYIEGEYLEVEPGAKLVFTWSHVSEGAASEKETTSSSQVTVIFEPEGEATRLRLVHEKIIAEDGRRGVGRGWQASFASLRAIIS